MQDQEFTEDQVSENLENQQSEFTAPETETLPGFNIENADLPEQETVVFSQPVENTTAEQFEGPVQTIYSADIVEDEELFGKYEIKNWDFNSRLYKIFAFAAIFNILFVVAVAQTNILRAKACDSPLVGGFCQVLDTLYVGGKILGTDNEFVSEPYEKREIEDAEIVWLDQTGIEPPLNYPTGYFQIANPEMFEPLPNPDNSGFPTVVNTAPMNPTTQNSNPVMPNPSNNSGVFSRPQKLAKPNKNAIPKDLPDGIIIPSTEDNTKTKNPTVADNKNKNKTPEQTDSKQPDIKSAAVDEVKINRQPFDDFGIGINEKRDKEKLDLTKPFELVMAGQINKDGTIDTAPDKSRFIRQRGDEKLIEVAKEAIEAIGESGILRYLSNLDVEQLNLQLVQTDNEIKVIIISDQKTASQAKTKASALNVFLIGAKAFAKTDDEKLMLEGAKVTNDGKNFVINFNLTKEIAHPMINRALEKVEAKRKEREAEQKKPNSTAQTANPKENTSK